MLEQQALIFDYCLRLISFLFKENVPLPGSLGGPQGVLMKLSRRSVLNMGACWNNSSPEQIFSTWQSFGLMGFPCRRVETGGCRRRNLSSWQSPPRQESNQQRGEEWGECFNFGWSAFQLITFVQCMSKLDGLFVHESNVPEESNSNFGVFFIFTHDESIHCNECPLVF